MLQPVLGNSFSLLTRVLHQLSGKCRTYRPSAFNIICRSANRQLRIHISKLQAFSGLLLYPQKMFLISNLGMPSRSATDTFVWRLCLGALLPNQCPKKQTFRNIAYLHEYNKVHRRIFGGLNNMKIDCCDYNVMQHCIHQPQPRPSKNKEIWTNTNGGLWSVSLHLSPPIFILSIAHKPRST